MFNPSDNTWGDDPETAAQAQPSRAAITARTQPGKAAAAAHDGVILVLAGVGTGKTKTLTSGVTLRIAERGNREDAGRKRERGTPAPLGPGAARVRRCRSRAARALAPPDPDRPSAGVSEKEIAAKGGQNEDQGSNNGTGSRGLVPHRSLQGVQC